MTNVNAYIQTFAGGEFGGAMSARVAIDSYQASCELMENFFMTAQGPMTRRPSLEYIDSFLSSASKATLKGFEFDVGQNYLLLVQNPNMYFYLNDGIIETDNVSGQFANGSFANFASWTDNSDTGATASAAGGYLQLVSNGAATPRARSNFAVNDVNENHIATFDVINGPVRLKVGSTSGGNDLIDFPDLFTGHHRLSFTPSTSGSCFIEFSSTDGRVLKQLDNVAIATGATAILMPIPWSEDDLRGVFTEQDGDRLYMFHRDYPPRVLERRDHRSWSLIYFEPDDGPFVQQSGAVRMTPGALTGTCALTPSESLFGDGDVRRLVRLTHPGQFSQKLANRSSVYGDAIKVSGLAADRAFTVSVTGTFVGTVTLQRSVGNQNDFSKVLTVTAGTSAVYNDSYGSADSPENGGATNNAVFSASQNATTRGRMDNQTVFYRWVVDSGDYTSGTVNMQISTLSGSQVGIARILTVTNGTTAVAEILKPFSQASETDIWDYGSWTDVEEWPNVVAFAHGRLWTFRRRELWSSKSDDYFSFQDGTDANLSVQLTLRSKSAEGVRWARELDFLCVGTRNEEYVIRATSAAEPIGPTSTEPTLQGEEGGAGVEAAIGGDSIIYIHRNGRRVMQFSHNPRALSEDSFISVDLTRLNPEACEDGVVAAVVQQEPERRVFIVTRAGIVKPALFRREEEIMGWGTMTTDGIIEDVFVLREAAEDATYFIVRRFIGGQWVRMIERLRSEVFLNDEDLVHMDSMLETEIVRPEFGITPDAINVGPVNITSTDDVFAPSDVGNIIWNNGGQILIGTVNNARSVAGTIVYPLEGKLDYVAAQVNGRPVYNPAFIPPGRWGIAVPRTSVSGLSHLEGRTVHVWADMAYKGTRTVSSGQVALNGTYSRVFVGLNFTSVWKSLKLAYGAAKGTAITQRKRTNAMGLVLDRTADTLLMGDTPGMLKELVKSTPGSLMGGKRYFSGEAFENFEGQYALDPRIIIATANPGPATIRALVPNIQINER